MVGMATQRGHAWPRKAHEWACARPLAHHVVVCPPYPVVAANGRRGPPRQKRPATVAAAVGDGIVAFCAFWCLLASNVVYPHGGRCQRPSGTTTAEKSTAAAAAAGDGIVAFRCGIVAFRCILLRLGMQHGVTTRWLPPTAAGDDHDRKTGNRSGSCRCSVSVRFGAFRCILAHHWHATWCTHAVAAANGRRVPPWQENRRPRRRLPEREL